MSDSESVTLEKVEDLLGVVDLQGVEVYEIRGRGVERTEGETAEDGYTIKAAVMASDSDVKTRFMLTFKASGGEYFVDLAMRYGYTSVFEGGVPQEIAVEFTERVGVMAAFPFLREQIHGIATRLGHPVPVLGLIRQGQFNLSIDDPDAD